MVLLLGGLISSLFSAELKHLSPVNLRLWCQLLPLSSCLSSDASALECLVLVDRAVSTSNLATCVCSDLKGWSPAHTFRSSLTYVFPLHPDSCAQARRSRSFPAWFLTRNAGVHREYWLTSDDTVLHQCHTRLLGGGFYFGCFSMPVKSQTNVFDLVSWCITRWDQCLHRFTPWKLQSIT